ncbi:hypothetical protein BJX96DRAFT_167134 [Aspergillus floccosus]
MDEEARKQAEMGYTQDLRRHLSVLYLFSIAFSLAVSWFSISASLITAINAGDAVLTISGLLWICFVAAYVGITLLELASVMPNAGRHYSRASERVPQLYASFAIYLTGWSAWAGAIFTCASVASSSASMGVEMWKLGHPDFVPLVNFFVFWFDCFGKGLPKVATPILDILFISSAVLFITVPATALPIETAKLVFPNFVNSAGWPSRGIDFVLGLIDLNWGFVCFDSNSHLAAFTQSRNSLLITILLAVLTSTDRLWFYYTLRLLSLQDFDAILKNPAGFPVLARLGQPSRLCWSFARDRSLPGSAFLAKIHPTLNVPLNAHRVSCFIVGLLGLSYSGSSAAFNSIVTACIVLLYVSYVIPVVCLLWQGWANIEHWRFWLGSVGLASNVIVLYSFPAVYPVTPGAMSPSI